jgi:hypothetical protein
MRISSKLVLAVVLLCVVGSAVPASAQEVTSVTFEKGVVEEVVGNHLWARGVHNGKNGIHHFYVPEDFRFLLDGRQVSIHELRKGMKLDATIIKHLTAQSKGQMPEAQLETHVAEVKKQGEVKKQTAAAPAPVPPAPAPAPAPAAEPAPKLPKTAGPLPLLGLVGLSLVGAGVGSRLLRSRNT